MRKVLIAMLAMLPAVPAQAGTRAVYEERAERREIIFEIDEDMNFRAGREDQYRLVLGDDAYQVAEVDGRFYVAHVEDLGAALKETASPLLRKAAKALTFFVQSDTWVGIGRKKVNGRPGQQYRLQNAGHTHTDDEDLFEHDDESVVTVSDDPALEPLGDAMLRYTAEELYLKRHFVNGRTYDAVLRDLDELARLGAVIASSEGDIRLASVEEANIDPERLALPAQPMSQSEIVALIRAKKNPFKL